MEADLSSRSIEIRLKNYGWTRWLPNVYLLPGVVPDAAGRLRAALLWAGDEALLCHVSAAYVHKLEGAEAPTKPELYTASGKNSSKVQTYRMPKNMDRCRARASGLRVTRVERTLGDLCSRWPPSRAGRAMDDALRRGLTTIDRLKAEAAGMNAERRTGAAVFRRLVSGRDHRDAEVRSELETRVLRFLNRVAPPVANHRVSAAGRTYYLDFAYPDLKLAIECQGIRWHLGEEAFKNDMTRHRHLSAAGWLVLFVCWDDVVFNIKQLEREIIAARRNREALIRPKLL